MLGSFPHFGNHVERLRDFDFGQDEVKSAHPAAANGCEVPYIPMIL